MTENFLLNCTCYVLEDRWGCDYFSSGKKQLAAEYSPECAWISVEDPDPFDTDPDPAFHFDMNPDPNPTFQFDTDKHPDPDPPFQRTNVPKTVLFIHL
jgi:hypothetical protein